MDARLRRLITDYQLTVAGQLEQLLADFGIKAPKSNTEWACSDLRQRGWLSDGSLYFKHGYGCSIKGPHGTVDFDFGANGEIDGFTASCLWGFADASSYDYGFNTKTEIAAAIEKAALNNEMWYSGYIYYLTASGAQQMAELSCVPRKQKRWPSWMKKLLWFVIPFHIFVFGSLVFPFEKTGAVLLYMLGVIVGTFTLNLILKNRKKQN